MCGIFCSLSCDNHITPDPRTKHLLENRGPDSTGQHQVVIETHLRHDAKTSAQIHATFVSTVLSLRGTSVVQQPLVDKSVGSVLCWNGEAWSIGGEVVAGNDSSIVFDKLLKASHSEGGSMFMVINTLASIRGPYALVFYDARNKHIYYGRDCLGRRSLLTTATPDGALILSSVCDNISGDAWSEVEANGIYFVDLSFADSAQARPYPQLIPHRRSDHTEGAALSFSLPFPTMNCSLAPETQHPDAQVVNRLRSALSKSLHLRTQHVREAVQSNAVQHAKIAVLFSGGLDCTVLARMCHDILPIGESIDLLNVAFENPRIHGKLDPSTSPYELCPDRITGRSSYAELTNKCSERIWRFVEINVPYTETQAHRSVVVALMHPHNTEMDLSISYALYFASRGTGVVRPSRDNSPEMYSTTAHVLLSGLGADELFGGYQRHATGFARQGYDGLLQELELDFGRLGKRNLGRDDRVISNSGKEVRYPFLDEDFIALALELPVTSKCDFGKPQIQNSQDPHTPLEPGKRILRLLAWELGMKSVAAEKKRAIQFGARTAKMETGKTKGTHVLS